MTRGRVRWSVVILFGLAGCKCPSPTVASSVPGCVPKILVAHRGTPTVDGEDEEWAVELKVPWKRLGSTGRPTQLPVNFSRLETLDGERLREVWSRTCGAIHLE